MQTYKSDSVPTYDETRPFDSLFIQEKLCGSIFSFFEFEKSSDEEMDDSEEE